MGLFYIVFRKVKKVHSFRLLTQIKYFYSLFQRFNNVDIVYGITEIAILQSDTTNFIRSLENQKNSVDRYLIEK